MMLIISPLFWQLITPYPLSYAHILQHSQNLPMISSTPKYLLEYTIWNTVHMWNQCIYMKFKVSLLTFKI